jgi:hypothetical protein
VIFYPANSGKEPVYRGFVTFFNEKVIKIHKCDRLLGASGAGIPAVHKGFPEGVRARGRGFYPDDAAFRTGGIGKGDSVTVEPDAPAFLAAPGAIL